MYLFCNELKCICSNESKCICFSVPPRVVARKEGEVQARAGEKAELECVAHGELQHHHHGHGHGGNHNHDHDDNHNHNNSHDGEHNDNDDDHDGGHGDNHDDRVDRMEMMTRTARQL